MFYEVRILDSEGNVKKVLSGKKLSSNYWKGFYDKIKSKSPMGSNAAKRKGSNPVKSREKNLAQLGGQWNFEDMVQAFRGEIENVNKNNPLVEVTTADIELEFTISKSGGLKMLLGGIELDLGKAANTKHRMKLTLVPKNHKNPPTKTI